MFIKRMYEQADGRHSFEVTNDEGKAVTIKNCGICANAEFIKLEDANYICVYFETMEEDK